MNLEGKLLVSHPNMAKDSIFYKSVIYLYQDRVQQGSIGVITNKPSKFTLGDLCNEKAILGNTVQEMVYHGGPVNTNALVLLHTAGWSSQNTAGAGNNLFITSDNLMLEKLVHGDVPRYWRLFGGLCGWAPGQLIAELEGRYPFRAENSWLIAEPNTELLFEETGDKQWKTAVELSSQQMFDQYF